MHRNENPPESEPSEQIHKASEAEVFFKHLQHRLRRGAPLQETIEKLREDIAGPDPSRRAVLESFNRLIEENKKKLNTMARENKPKTETENKPPRREVVDPILAERKPEPPGR